MLDTAGHELVHLQFGTMSPADYPRHEAAVPAETSRHFVVRLPFDERTHSIIFERAGAEVHRITVPAHAPTIRLLGAPPSFGANEVTIRWSAIHPDGSGLTYDVALLYPRAPGLHVLAKNLTSDSFTFTTGRIPGGDGVTLRVEASDGFHQTAAEWTGLNIPNHAPEVAIAYPRSGEQFQANGKIFLRALALDPEEGALRGSHVQWTSDRDGPLGEGLELLASLKPGRHMITVTATDAHGLSAQGQVNITVVPGGR